MGVVNLLNDQLEAAKAILHGISPKRDAITTDVGSQN